MVPMKSHEDFSRLLVKKRVVLLDRIHFCKVRTHFYHNASTRRRFCDRRVVERNLVCTSQTEDALTQSLVSGDEALIHGFRKGDFFRAPLESSVTQILNRDCQW